MRTIIFYLLITFSTAAVSATECDCSNYPFQPNPPCYGICIDKLSSAGHIDTQMVTGIDPGVAVGINVISESKFRDKNILLVIKGKKGLEREALRLMSAKDSESNSKY